MSIYCDLGVRRSRTLQVTKNINYLRTNIMMTSPSVLFALALRFILAPVAWSQSEGLPCVVCAYAGSLENTTYKFSIADVPERCDAVWYSDYYMDAPFDANDLSAIASLVAANKKVYVSVTYKTNNVLTDILTANDTALYDQHVPALEKFVSDNKISGILLEGLSLFAALTSDYACRVDAFVSKLKANMPTTKVGLYVTGYMWAIYGIPEIFDFSLTTSVDFYMVDVGGSGNGCVANKPRFPLTTTNENVTSIELICQSLGTSGMDQNKLMVNLIVMVNVVKGDTRNLISYSKYCTGTGSNSSQVVCSDSLQAVYDMAAYVKPYFKSMMISFVDSDDFDGSCGCSVKFPVTNTYIDGWQSKEITCCDKITGK